MDPRPLKYVAPTSTEESLAYAPEPVVIYDLPSGGGGGGGDVASVNGKTGTVVLNAADVGAAPTNHTHAISTITGLQAELDSKATPSEIPSTPGDIGAATAAQGSLADTAVQPAALSTLVPNTRTVAGKPLSSNVSLDKVDVGLGNVDNVAAANLPVSTAQQTALNLKAPLASPAFTGTPTGITKAHVGLGNVDNTSDANKPVSTAQASAIAAKVGSPNSSITGLAYYPTVASLPATGTAGVIYYVDQV